MYKIEKNQPVPDYVEFKNTNFEIACMDGKILIFLKECQDAKDALNFEKSNINFSVSIIDRICFFLVDIDKCGLICDFPYNFHQLPSIDDVFPIKEVYLFFVDDKKIIRAMRGMTLVSEKVSNLLLSTLDKPLEKDANKIIDEIYEKYPEIPMLKNINNYEIEWVKMNTYQA